MSDEIKLKFVGKYCPLKTTCTEKECAWWMKQNQSCAILSIAEDLKALVVR